MRVLDQPQLGTILYRNRMHTALHKGKAALPQHRLQNTTEPPVSPLQHTRVLTYECTHADTNMHTVLFHPGPSTSVSQSLLSSLALPAPHSQLRYTLVSTQKPSYPQSCCHVCIPQKQSILIGIKKKKKKTEPGQMRYRDMYKTWDIRPALSVLQRRLPHRHRPGMTEAGSEAGLLRALQTELGRNHQELRGKQDRAIERSVSLGL